MKKSYFSLNFIKKNIRYIFAALAIVLMFLISRSFPAQIITSESCAGNNCQAILESPNLTKEKSSYYVNDVMKSSPGQYYRLTFFSRTNKGTRLAVKITNPSDEDKELKILDLKEAPKNSPQEIVFASDRYYSDILFEKTNANDGAEISISNVQISELNVSNEKEFASLAPTIWGEIDIDQADQKQTDSAYSFQQLKDPGMILGQIFKPQSDHIAGVTLDIDIVKQDNSGGKKYKLELRDADFSGSVPEVSSNILSSVSFSVSDLEKYRQADGKFKFPLFSRLDRGKYYFIGIDNNTGADKYNYLRIKGTQDTAKYPDGTVAVKYQGQTYAAPGSLYFITYGVNFAAYNGKKMLGGEIIEDTGQGHGIFTYQPNGNIYDLANLEQYSPDINYDDSKNSLAGTIKPGLDSYMIYKFDTIFPAKNMQVSGEQASSDWDQVSVSYSYDNENWKEIPYQENVLQQFDYSWNDIPPAGEVYIKIAPKDKDAADKKSYGLSNFKVEAELIMNK